MLNTTALILWSVAGTLSASNYTSSKLYLEWRTLTTHPTPTACHTTARNLGLKQPEYRCIVLSTGDIAKETP
jgi:hypothetical protein